MARFVKISTMSGDYATIKEGISWPDAIRQMKHHLEARIDLVLPDQPDLIVMPECCDMPINVGTEQQFHFYRERGDDILHFLGTIAAANHCYIAYPSIRQVEDGTWRNSLQLLDRSGTLVGSYNKNHPVIGEGVLSGRDAAIMKCDFGTVGAAICFDLNFDELRLKIRDTRPDIILFPSMFHGSFLQSYWAYSCRAHFVSSICNPMPSSILSPVGHMLAQTTPHYETVTATVNLDCAVIHLDKHRDKLRAMKSKYGRKVKVHDPGYLGSVLISSETEQFTIQDIMNEFHLTLVDEYFAHSLLDQMANKEK